MFRPLHSVLVTGASTGIGYAIAVDLAKSNHQVFASVRKTEDAKRLELENSNIIGVVFDVCDDAGIQAAYKTIRSRLVSGQTFSLINNAGIAVPGPLESLPLIEFRKQFETNVFGALRVTQVFLPLIREASSVKGRIINMSSVSGLMTAPFLGAYSASKYALEAVSDALRRELVHEGIKVLLIEPGLIQTPIWGKGEHTVEMPMDERYRKPYQRFVKGMAKRVERQALPVDLVTESVRRALFEDEPPVRQIVASVPMRMQIQIGSLVPEKWMDRLIVRDLFK
jgi:NAD(P)-dependent dehydrogenase (short-subunit alcohol dehydrogenase family)